MGDGARRANGAVRLRAHWRGLSLSARLEAYSIPEPMSGCVLWFGGIAEGGYGKVRDGARILVAHRAAYELARGPVPAGLHLDHLCRNRACINPAHLEAVTPQENALRGNGACARNARKTKCNHGHRLSGANLALEKGGRRRCLACRRSRRASPSHRQEVGR